MICVRGDRWRLTATADARLLRFWVEVYFLWPAREWRERRFSFLDWEWGSDDRIFR